MALASPPRIDDRLRSLALEALKAAPPTDSGSDPALARLREVGTELWLDTGNLDEARGLWRNEFSALTTNNTLANQVVQTGILDDVVKETISDLLEADPEISDDQMVMELGFVVNCHIALRLVKAFGAMVSVELHPSVAEDIESTVHYAERYFAVCPERFYIKIPLTPEGYCSVARVRAKNIPVNYTLGFSARQNYLAAVISNPTFCNVFLGRLNAVISENRLGDGKSIGERAALATQQAIRKLRDEGRSSTRLIAASMRSPEQVASLAGVDVFTMPPKVAKQFMESRPDPAGISSQLDRELAVTFSAGTDTKRFDVLWNVDEKVHAVAEDLKRRDVTTLNGDDLREADAQFDSQLFHRFSSAEVIDIRDRGKIPDWDRWSGEKRVALDGLMTESALQSFVVDQAALDDHLRLLIRER